MYGGFLGIKEETQSTMQGLYRHPFGPEIAERTPGRVGG